MYAYADNPPYECSDCIEKDNRLVDIVYWFRAVLDQLYGIEEFDDMALEHYLDELSGYLKMKLPARNLAVTHKEPILTFPELEEWKRFNTNYFKELSKVGV